MKRAIFLDRDGVINRKAPEGNYITRWEDFEFLPGVPQAVRAFNQAGFLVIVVTNQRCVARKLLTEAALEAIHAGMLSELKNQGAVINAVYYCPHEIAECCPCRKPSPAMILQAAKEYGISLDASWMVGDSPIDVETGKAAGSKTVWLARSYPDEKQALEPDLIAGSLSEAAARILDSTDSTPRTRG